MPDDLTNLDSPMSVADENRRHVIFPWTKQAGLKPKEIVRAEGVHVWDGSGKGVRERQLVNRLANASVHASFDILSQIAGLNFGCEHHDREPLDPS